MNQIYEQQLKEFCISTDPSRLDHDAVYKFLSNTYWGRQRPRPVFDKAMKHSLCFGVYKKREQVGFARVITDYATYAYLADVYVEEAHRGQGLGRWLVKSILAHPELVPMRRWALITKDAHKLYRGCGFSPLNEPEHHMQRLEPYTAETNRLKSSLLRFSKKVFQKRSAK